MNNEKKSNKLKIVTLILMILLVLTGTSYAIITWSYEGKTDNLLSTPDISFRFLESNKEVIGIENGVPMTDEQGMNQTGTGNVFDFEVKSKFNANTDVKYTVSLEKLTIDSGKTQIPEDEIKIYVEDFEGKTVLKPTKISDLDNYNLFIKTDRHSKDNEEISSKYRLKVWLDESVDVFTNQNRQYKFKINVGTTEQEQNPNQTYNLVYNLNGGTGNINSTSFKVGDKVTITSTVPTKDGYKFLGWSTNKNNSNAEYTSGEQVSLTNAYNNTVTLYAIWQGDITYTVKYNPNGGYVKNITTVEPDVNYDPNNYGDTPWITENGIYKSNNQGTDSSYSSLWHSIEIDKETTLSFEVAVSSEQNDGLSININNSTDGSKTYSKILYGNSNINNEINLSYENIDVTLQKGTYLLSFEYTKNSTLSEGLDRAYVKNIKLSSTSDETIEDSIFKSGTNKLTKNIYVRDHYIFKGWSLNKDATIATYQDEQEVDNLTKKNNDIVNLYAVWEKEKYAVNVVVQNGTVDTSSKQISYNESGTFNLTKTIEDTIGTVTCTNNQTGKIENNILTVSNVSRDTTCTVIFKEAITTLYEDGTLIINESVKNRNTNSSTHGSITKEYDAMDENNSYIFKSECIPDKGCISNSLWNNEKDSILSVEIGKNMSPLSTANWFIEHTNLKDGNFKNLDTSNVTDMSFMFKYAGKSTNTFELTGLENWNTSSVTDMSNMFYNAGERSTTWSIGDLSKWDTSSVTDMSHMFYLAGPQATTWSIGDLSKWDTSSVTNMSFMFASAGRSATSFELTGLENWNVSKVTDMSSMFYYVGYSATTFNMNLSNWDTSKVTDMNNMFASVGASATSFELTGLENWNVSNVTSMGSMFSSTALNATSFELTGLDNWNVSKVTDMRSMFASTGPQATTWSIGDISKWDTSSVTDMSYMFDQAGSKATTFNLDLTNWKTSSVTDMSHMFYLAGPQATTWSIGDLSKWDTSKVTDMSYMFASAGKSATTFDLNLSKWDTSSVTNMRYMFAQAGSSATTWTVKIPSKTGDSTNTTSRWYGSSSRVYATPCSGKSFTLNYDVNAVIQGGGLAEGESATKSVSGGSNVTFNLVPNSTGSSASVTCTNNQTGSVTNNILTVTNVSASTTCTVIFSSDSTSTVLYNDGTLIINENSTNRNSNITTHGAVVKEYEPMSNSNSYVFELSGPEGDIPHPNYPWLNEKSSVKKVEIGQRIKPVSTAYWNAYLENMESGDFTNLDTSSVTDMEGMFMYAGTSGYINVFTLVGLSNFNVSSVNNMTTLFLGTGLGAKTWNIGDLSNWDVSNVTSMGGMFSSAALNATSFNIGNLSNWDVSNVTDMVEMFSNFDDDGTPGNQQEWYVGDISKWKPLNATDMSRMFMYVGYNVDDFSLDLSNWDVSNVTDMTNMFYNVGYNSSTFNLNLSNWNMSNVETVDGMFEEIGESASDWTLTIPSSTGSIDNDEEHLYGSSSSIYVEPPTGKSFTLA